MNDLWRRWRYPKYETSLATSDDFGQFSRFASGPWTPDMTVRMPWDVLIAGPKLGEIDPATRRVIDLEVERRLRSRQPVVANVIALASLVISLIALIRSH